MPEFKSRDTARARALRRVGPWFADFLCRELSLVIEIDGFSHEVRSDAARGAWIARHGYRVLRFTNADVLGNTEGVFVAICEEVARLRAVATTLSATLSTGSRSGPALPRYRWAAR